MSSYRLKPGPLGRWVVKAYKGVEERFTRAFLAPDGSLKTGGMAPTVTGAYRKVESAFVRAFLEKTDDQH